MNSKSLEEGNRRKDIISGLPDGVLCHILSCLPTEDAVRTTILSSRWKDLWTSIYNLHFDDFPVAMRNVNCRTWFVNFVNQALIVCQSKDIHDFHVKCSYLWEEDLSHVSEWVCFAARLNVRHLILSINISSEAPLRLPQCILTCKTLVELNLGKDFVIDIPDSIVCFPSLKILNVQIEHPNGDLMQKFFGRCPVLEDLSIRGCLAPVDNVVTFNITVPSLKRLKIFMFVKYRLASDHIFVIRTPNLEYLEITTIQSSAYFLVNEIPSLKEAFVSIGCYVSESIAIARNEANRALKLLRGIRNAKILSLSKSTMMALGFPHSDNLPTFPHLTHLKLAIESYYHWKLLTPFLNNSPNLKVLDLDLLDAREFDRCYQIAGSDECLDWVEPKSAPSCLLLHVKVIKIRRMQSEAQQLEVVKYLLQNGKILGKFSVDFLEPLEEEKLQKEILMFPKGSETCAIEFL